MTTPNKKKVFEIPILFEDLLTGNFPESWSCVDCGFDTAPGMLAKADAKRILKQARNKPNLVVLTRIDKRSEVYLVRKSVWTKAGLADFGGCLCIGCLERRIGRELKAKDFLRNHVFNKVDMPGTPRLLRRRNAR